MSKQQKILSQQEIRKLLDGASNNVQETSLSNRFDVMLIKTCLGHGLRNEETVTLQRKHIREGNWGVEIEDENTKSEAGVRFVPTIASIRDIEIKSEFKRWVADQTEDRDDYLFPSPRGGGHISTRYFQDLMLDLAWELGFYPHLSSKDEVRKEVDEEKRVRPHALRHTYGTRNYENGIPPKELQSLMGHESRETTMDLYTHLSNERTRDRLDNAGLNWD